MIKTKLLSIILVIITLCGVCLIFAGCSDEKYDISLKVVCREWLEDHYSDVLEEWIFEPGLDNICIERAYDGKQYSYILEGFNYINRPYAGDIWFNSLLENTSQVNCEFWNKDTEHSSDEVVYLCENGEYIFSASISGDNLNGRYIHLYITVV